MRSLILIICIVFLNSLATAQQKKITFEVKDKSGNPLQAVEIKLFNDNGSVDKGCTGTDGRVVFNPKDEVTSYSASKSGYKTEEDKLIGSTRLITMRKVERPGTGNKSRNEEKSLEEAKSLRNSTKLSKDYALKILQKIINNHTNSNDQIKNSCSPVKMESLLWKAYILKSYDNPDAENTINELEIAANNCKCKNYMGWVKYFKNAPEEAIKKFTEGPDTKNCSIISTTISIAYAKLILLIRNKVEKPNYIDDDNNRASIRQDQNEILELIQSLQDKEKNEGDRIKANLHLWVGMYLSKDKTEMEQECEKASSLFKKLDDQAGQARALLRCGQIKAQGEKFVDARKDLNDSKKYFEAAGLEKKHALAVKIELERIKLHISNNLDEAKSGYCTIIGQIDSTLKTFFCDSANQSSPKPNIENNENYFYETVKNNHPLVEALLDLADIYERMASNKEAIMLFNFVSKMYNSYEDDMHNKYILRAWNGRGNIYHNQNNLSAAIDEYKNVIEDCEQNKTYPIDKANAYIGLGKSMFEEIKNCEGNNTNDIEYIIQNYKKAQKLYEKKGSNMGVAIVNMALGDISIYQHKYEDAENHYTNALNSYSGRTYDNAIGQGDALRGLGHLAYIRNDVVKAKQHYDDAIKQYKSKLPHSKKHVANLEIYLGDYYSQENEYESAIRNYNSALEWYKLHPEQFISQQALAHRKLGASYEKLEKNKDARDNYEHCEKLYQDLKSDCQAKICQDLKRRLQ